MEDPQPQSFSGGLFFDVMSHASEFSDVTTDEGAALFNSQLLASKPDDHEVVVSCQEKKIYESSVGRWRRRRR